MKCAVITVLLIFATPHLTATSEQTSKASSRETKLVVSTMVGSAAAAVIALICRDVSLTRLWSAVISVRKKDHTEILKNFGDFEKLSVGILLATPPLAAAYVWDQKAQLRKEQEATTRLQS